MRGRRSVNNLGSPDGENLVCQESRQLRTRTASVISIKVEVQVRVPIIRMLVNVLHHVSLLECDISRAGMLKILFKNRSRANNYELERSFLAYTCCALNTQTRV